MDILLPVCRNQARPSRVSSSMNVDAVDAGALRKLLFGLFARLRVWSTQSADTPPPTPLRERVATGQDVDSGSARLAQENADSPTGSRRAFFKVTGGHQSMERTVEVMLKDGHKAPCG